MKIFFSFSAFFFAKILIAQNPQLIIPRGHSDNISVTALSPDGKLLVSGGWDKAVKIWDKASGKELITLDNFPGWVRSIAFSPDGKKLVTGSFKQLRINDISLNGKEIYKDSIHPWDIEAIAFSPDGKLLATGSQMAPSLPIVAKFEIIIWNVSDMAKLKTVGAKGEIRSIQFDNNNELLSISDSQIYHINVPQGIITQTEQYNQGISKLSPDGKWVVRTGFDFREETDSVKNGLLSRGQATLNIVNRFTKQVIKKTMLLGTSTGVKNVSFSLDSRYFACATNGETYNTIFIYDLQTMKVVKKFADKMSYPSAITFTKDDKELIVGNFDNYIRIWNLASEKIIQKLGAVAKTIFNISLSADDKSLAMIGATYNYGKGGGFIQTLNLQSSKIDKHFNGSKLGTTLKYSPDGKYFVAGSFEGGMGVWNSTTSKKLNIFSKKNVSIFVFSPDGKFIVTADEKAAIPEILVQAFPSGELINTVKLPDIADAFTFSADGSILYVGLYTDDKTLKLDFKTGKILQTFRHQGNYNNVTGVHKLLFNKEETALLTGDRFSKVRWWNIITGREERGIEVHSEELNDMIRSAGAKEFITCAGKGAFLDSSIKIIDIASGKLKALLNGHTNSPTSLAVTKNGKFLFSGGLDKTIRLWDLFENKLLATMVFFDNSDWVIVDNQGRFDGTAEGMKKMYYVKGLEVMPLESGFEKFYTPNLLPRILEGENFVPLPVNIITLKDAPKVKITAAEMQRNLMVEDDAATYNTTKEQVTIKVQADCPNDGVTEIRLFQNGKLVETTRNLLVEDENKSEKSLTKTFTVNLSAGNNSFNTVAFNTERTESKPAEIIVNYKPANNEQPVIASTTLHLIVVGVNTYKNPKYNLNYALADATSFSEVITVGSKNLFSNTNSIFIKNEEATKEGITAAFEKIKAAAKPQDLFIFYYAGHGTMNDKNEFFLVPYDVTQIYGNDGALAQNGFSSALLKQMSKDIKAQKQLFILDACHSAAALEAVAGARGAPEEKAIAQLARATGTYWLTASSSDQYASEFSQLGHGSFTYCLLQAFKGDANPSDKKLTVKILDAYLQTKVPEITQKYKGTAQYPASYGYGNDFPILIVK